MNNRTLDMDTANEHLQELLSRANDNQEKVDRIQAAELELLQSESLPEVFNYLFNEHTLLFQLLSVNLTLVDAEQRTCRLLQETDATSRFQQCLKLITDSDTINRLKDLGTQPLLATYDTQAHGWLLANQDTRIKSIAILPLIRHNEVIGVATCTSADIERFQPDLGTDLLKRLATMLAISIENAVNHHHLRYLGLTDALTGVHNRRYLDQRLPEEIAGAAHSGKPLAFLFIDIDYFKKINDTYGHQTGDVVLQQVASLIYSQLRSADTLSRYGGEEFAILLKDLNITEAHHIAERIRLIIAEAQISSEDGIIPVTVSIGIAELTQLSDGAQLVDKLAHKLTQAADSALYQAKENGRNQVVVAS